MTVEEANELLKQIRELKYAFTRAQEFESGAMMRDLERKYMDKKIETK